jgi:NAD(P)-dependent dehydrogenase (short-subunit alcohol dehydrogenase family)
LGAALFTELAGRGNRILAIGRRFTDEQRGLAAAEPGRIRLYEADLAAPSTLPDAADLRGFLSGSTDCSLIHNAGLVDPVAPIGQLPPATVTAAVAVNLTAPVLLTNAFVAAWPAGAEARVVFISSGAAHRVIEGWSVYSATKRGAEMFFDALAVEQPGMYVVNVNPGVMDTGMQATLRGSEFPDRDRYVSLHERGQLPDPATVARRIISEHLERAITHE